jgi:hypothetical protein
MINDLSIDIGSEFVASASMDGESSSFASWSSADRVLMMTRQGIDPVPRNARNVRV